MRGKSKYGNVKSGGHASKKEAARAATLKLLEKAGKIKDLQEQVTYTLIPAQFEGEGKNRHCVELACKYVADFVYTDVETGDLGPLGERVAGEAGTVRHVSVMFYGEGPACAALHAKQAMA